MRRTNIAMHSSSEQRADAGLARLCTPSDVGPLRRRRANAGRADAHGGLFARDGRPRV